MYILDGFTTSIEVITPALLLLFPPRVCVAFVLSDTTVWQVSTEPVLPLYHCKVFRPDFGGDQDFLQF